MKISKTFNVKQVITLFTGTQAQTWGSVAAFLREVYTAISSNLTLGDNVVGQFSTIHVHTSASYTSGVFHPIVVPWTFGNTKAPQSVLIGQIVTPSNEYPLLSAQSAMWTYNQTTQVITISYISGLNNSNKYTVTLEIK